MLTRLETDRLMLRQPTLDDLEDFVAMFSDARVTEFLSIDGKPMTRFAVWQSLTSTVGHWALRGYGMFVVQERTSGRFLGRVGPWWPEGWPGFELGWTLRSDAWGFGYATEAAERCLAYAFEPLAQPSVISLIVPENTRSIRVAERIGESFECETRLPHLPPDRRVLQYRVSADAWRARRRL
jgi:RimJ/RimL family protein N-acetyltransferase